MLKERYDVVIVGSGPAGASAAKALENCGVKVAIIEKAKLPRYKMCSGILFPRARKLVKDYFGDIPQNLYCEPKYVPGSKVEITLKDQMTENSFRIFDDDPSLEDYGVNVYRDLFDFWLIQQSSAEIIDKCKFKSVYVDKSHLVVTVDKDGESTKVETKYLIGADGCLSRVRHCIAPDLMKTLRLIPQYEEWYIADCDLEPGPIYAFYDRRITGFFAAVMHKDDNIIVTTGARDERPLKEYFDDFIRHLHDKYNFIVRKKLAEYGCVLHDMSVTDNMHMGDGNVLLVGEAGGFNRYAEGITSALITGRAAGKAITNCIRTGEPPLGEYIRSSADEREQCRKVSEIMSKGMRFNIFTRG